MMWLTSRRGRRSFVQACASARSVSRPGTRPPTQYLSRQCESDGLARHRQRGRRNPCHGTPTTIVADLGDPSQARGIVEKTVAELGSVDILVNNAAYAMAGDRVPVVELDDAFWHRVLDIKVHGSYYASKAAAQAMIRQGTGGSIVMVSSIAGKIHPRNFATYVVANMSLQGLTGSLSKELGDYNINVNTVCPGVIDTSRWDNKRDNTPTGREEWERLETNIPMGRPGTGTDVASAIVFLCSDQAHWISGQPINIDGGQVSSH